MNLCWITFDDLTKKNVRVISIKNRVKHFPKNWNITIISPNPILDEELKSYIKKNVVVNERIYGENFKSPIVLFRLIKILKKINKETKNFDVIITDTFYVPLFKYFSKKKIPIIMLSHGIISDEALSKKLITQNSLMYKFLLILEKKSYRLCNTIIAVTKEIKDYIVNEFHIDSSKISIIPNGVDPDLFKPKNKKECLRELKLNETDYHVCFVGNLVPWQGIEYLIQAAPTILKEIPNTKFLIIGDGVIKQHLVNLTIENKVFDSFIFTGLIPHEKTLTYINAGDVCVAPFTETRNVKIGLSPLKIYEYAACEKPIVASKIPGLEFIENVNAGIMTESNNSLQLSNAIIKLLKTPKLRLEMGKNGRRYVNNYNRWIDVSKKIEEVCKNLIIKKQLN